MMKILLEKNYEELCGHPS